MKIVEIITNILNYKGEIVWDNDKPDGRERVCLDCTFMKEVLPNWKQLSMEEGIKDTIYWFRNSMVI